VEVRIKRRDKTFQEALPSGFCEDDEEPIAGDLEFAGRNRFGMTPVVKVPQHSAHHELAGGDLGATRQSLKLDRPQRARNVLGTFRAEPEFLLAA
jgi:hypothetical protein